MTKSGKHDDNEIPSNEILDTKLLLNIIGRKGDIFLFTCSEDENMSLTASKIVWDEVKVHATDIWEESIYNFKGEIKKENIESIFADITLKISKIR